MINKAMILPLEKLYFVPPHSRAKSRQMTAGMKAIVPMGSNSFKRSENPTEAWIALFGDLKKNTMPRIATAPIGRLI